MYYVSPETTCGSEKSRSPNVSGSVCSACRQETDKSYLAFMKCSKFKSHSQNLLLSDNSPKIFKCNFPVSFHFFWLKLRRCMFRNIQTTFVSTNNINNLAFMFGISVRLGRSSGGNVVQISKCPMFLDSGEIWFDLDGNKQCGEAGVKANATF